VPSKSSLRLGIVQTGFPPPTPIGPRPAASSCGAWPPRRCCSGTPRAATPVIVVAGARQAMQDWSHSEDASVEAVSSRYGLEPWFRFGAVLRRGRAAHLPCAERRHVETPSTERVTVLFRAGPRGARFPRIASLRRGTLRVSSWHESSTRVPAPGPWSRDGPSRRIRRKPVRSLVSRWRPLGSQLCWSRVKPARCWRLTVIGTPAPAWRLSISNTASLGSP
jgi:hypothetical protein